MLFSFMPIIIKDPTNKRGSYFLRFLTIILKPKSIENTVWDNKGFVWKISTKNSILACRYLELIT